MQQRMAEGRKNHVSDVKLWVAENAQVVFFFPVVWASSFEFD